MSSSSFAAIAEDLQALSIEVKKKYPEIKEAVDKALTSLKAVKDGRISASSATLTPKADKAKDKEREKANNGMLSDLLGPYILTCNHADAPPKVASMAMSGMQLLINNDLIVGGDVKNILRVLSIQATSGKSEQQVKLLQIILQLITLLSKNSSFSKHLTESTISSFLSLSFQLCGDRGSVSVSSTAMTTARQVMSTILDGATNLFFSKEASPANGEYENSVYTTPPVVVQLTSQQESSPLYVCSLNILKDISLFMRCSTGEWLRSAELPQSFALDLIYHSLSGWRNLFLRVPAFFELLKDSIFPSLKVLLQELQPNYIYDCTNSSVSTAAALTSRIVRIGRRLLLTYITPNTIEETGVLITLLAHSLQPDRDDSTDTIRAAAKRSNSSVISKNKTTNIFEDAGALLKGGVGGFMSSLNLPMPKANTNTNSATGSGNMRDNNCMLELSSTNFPGFGSGAVEIPAHSAGVCLEALLSFFLSDIPNNMIHNGEGIDTLCSAMLVAMLNTSAIISGGITKKSNIAEFDSSVKGSKLISLIESVLVGKDVASSSGISNIIDSVHDQVMESASIMPAEVLILAVQLMQVITRLLVKLSIYSQSDAFNASISLSAEVSNNKRRDVIMFLPHSILSSKFSLTKESATSGGSTHGGILVAPMSQLCDEVYDSVQESCVNLLVNIKSAGIVKRSIGILSEVALTSGLLGLHRPCENVVSSLCKFTVPKWHGHELLDAHYVLSSKDTLKLRHVQACGRLMQIIHVIADAISDWDTIVDAFEQVARFTILAASSPAIANADGSPSSINGEIEKIMVSINKFKKYTIFLSDDALIKLITSLVALSMNNLAATTAKKPPAKAKSSSGAAAVAVAVAPAAKPVKASKNLHCSISYMADAVPNNLISFALQSAIEISKNNMHRLSTVWQMMTSHLRMVASSKNVKTRAVAVFATQDIVLSSLEYIQKPKATVDDITSIPDDVSPGDIATPSASKTIATISDEVVYSKIMPSVSTAFEPRDFHKKVLVRRLNNPAISYTISQLELLNSLNNLSSIRYDDVRIDVVSGLLRLLQGKGDIIDQGWGAIIELLATVAASMPAATIVSDSGDDKNDDNDKSIDYDDANEVDGATSHNKKEKPWPVVTLRSAFDCMKLIVDEFLDILPVSVIKSVIVSLSYFAAQAIDVNISLTSVEMLWKVGDLSLCNSKAGESTSSKPDSSNGGGSGDEDETESVLGVMMRRLLVLSTDGRPEVRNCGMNTLFSAMTANAQLLSSLQWKQVFDDVIFPLFERTGERSKRAARSKEVAKAPELKKGVRMAVHHSRDTAHKQWSETRSIALKGLARVVRTCSKSLLLEFWFRETWESSIEICTGAIQAALADMEVATAAVDVLFSMMKMVAITTSKNNSAATASPARKSSLHLPTSSSRDDEEELIVALEVAREELWKLAWLAVKDIASFDCPSQELPMHICQQMISLYVHGEAGEFRYSENIRGLLDMIVLVARPRMVLDADTLQPVIPKNHDRISEVRLYQSVMALLKLIKPGDIIAAGLLASALCEISFASQNAFTSSFFDDQVTVYLAACPEKLRVESADYLISLLTPCQDSAINSPEADEPESTRAVPLQLPKGAAVVILDVALRRFYDDICSPSVQARDSLVGLVLTRSETRSDRSMSDSEGGKDSGSKKRGSVGGFFANIGKLLSSKEESPPASSSSDSGAAFRTSQFLSSLHKLDHFTVTSELTSGILLSPTTNADHSDNKWTTFIPLNCEFTVLKSSLKLDACSSDDACGSIVFADGSVAVSDHTFGNVLSMLSCLMSPWRRCEIPSECFSKGALTPTTSPSSAGAPSSADFKSSIDSMRDTARSTLRHMLSPHVLNSLPHSWNLALFDIITTSCRLAVHAIASGSVENFDPNATSVSDSYSEAYFVEILDLVRISIKSILTADFADGSNKYKNQSSKKCALLALMTILRDICALSINPTSIHAQSASVVHSICDCFLTTFSDIDASWGILPRDFSVDRAAGVDAKTLMASWLQSVNCADVLAYSVPPPGFAATSGVSNPISRKAHCLLFLPLIIKLSSQSDQESTRSAASAIIEALNITSVVSSYMDLLTKNEAMVRDQERMAQEMYTLKSSNQLPF